jgi:hypothetical protein
MEDGGMRGRQRLLDLMGETGAIELRLVGDVPPETFADAYGFRDAQELKEALMASGAEVGCLTGEEVARLVIPGKEPGGVRHVEPDGLPEPEEYFPFEVKATETRQVRTTVYARNAREAEALASEPGRCWGRDGGKRPVRVLRPAQRIEGTSVFK